MPWAFLAWGAPPTFLGARFVLDSASKVGSSHQFVGITFGGNSSITAVQTNSVDLEMRYCAFRNSSGSAVVLKDAADTSATFF